MKIGRIPIAPIIVIVLTLTSLILNHIYPGQYKWDSLFIEGAFFGALLVYLLYYINIWVTAYANNKKEAENKSSH